jgi:hypothetical protein
MPWLKDVCVDTLCGASLGIVKGVFGISLFTAAEAEEILSLKQLALSVMQKSPEIVGEPIMCEAIRQGQKSALETFAKQATPEAVSAGVVVAAELLCKKAFTQRFADVLMGACLNLVGC